MRILWIAVLAVAALVTLGADGCRRGSKAPAVGPPFVAFIVDRTATTERFQAALLKYVEAGLDQYRRGGKMHFVLINLTGHPTMAREAKGIVTRDKMEQIMARIETMTYDGSGTDIVGAFDKAYEYYTYDRPKPKAFRILCFSDGIIEGKGMRSWEELDAGKLRRAGASVGIYFLKTELRGTVEKALADLSPIVLERGQAEDDVKAESFQFPGIRR